MGQFIWGGGIFCNFALNFAVRLGSSSLGNVKPN